MVTFDWREQGGVTCGGALIDTSWVVTAKHCTKDLPANVNDREVRIGSRYRARGGEVRHVIRKFEHPSSDLALLLLDHPSGNSPVTLTSKRNFRNNAPAVVFGYGLSPHGELQEASQPIRRHSNPWSKSRDCALPEFSFRFVRGVNGELLRAGHYTSDAPHTEPGDSGGPLLVGGRRSGARELAGVLSITDPSCPALYVRLTENNALRDWISGILADYDHLGRREMEVSVHGPSEPAYELDTCGTERDKLVFTIRLSDPTTGDAVPALWDDVSVGYATADGTAHSGSDYIPASGTAVIRAGESETTIAVSVLPDIFDFDLGTEFMYMRLVSSPNVKVGTAEAVGFIGDETFICTA